MAKEAGLCYASIAMATDYDCWRATGERVCVGDVLATFKKNVTKITKLITTVVPKIGKEDWNETISELKVFIVIISRYLKKSNLIFFLQKTVESSIMLTQ